MTLSIKLFGMLKTLVPQPHLAVEVPAGSQVKDVVDHLQTQYPQVGELILKKKVLISVNQEIAHWETVIGEQDEIALLPPFAGGGGRPRRRTPSLIHEGASR